MRKKQTLSNNSPTASSETAPTLGQLVAVINAALKAKGAFLKAAGQAQIKIYQFQLSGPDGGDWAIIVDERGGRAELGLFPDPVLCMATSMIVFREILTGAEVPPQDVHVEGDVAGLRRLIVLMSEVFRVHQQKERSVSPLQLRTGLADILN